MLIAIILIIFLDSLIIIYAFQLSWRFQYQACTGHKDTQILFLNKLLWSCEIFSFISMGQSCRKEIFSSKQRKDFQILDGKDIDDRMARSTCKRTLLIFRCCKEYLVEDILSWTDRRVHKIHRLQIQPNHLRKQKFYSEQSTFSKPIMLLDCKQHKQGCRVQMKWDRFFPFLLDCSRNSPNWILGSLRKEPELVNGRGWWQYK